MNTSMVVLAADTVEALLSMAEPLSLERSNALMPSLVSFDPRIGRLSFITSGKGTIYTQIIDFIDWEQYIPEDVITQNPNFDQIKTDFPEVLGSAIQVHCYCPAFQFWGHWYNLNERDTSINKGIGPLNPTDPNYPRRTKAFSCKHLLAVYTKHLNA